MRVQKAAHWLMISQVFSRGKHVPNSRLLHFDNLHSLELPASVGSGVQYENTCGVGLSRLQFECGAAEQAGHDAAG